MKRINASRLLHIERIHLSNGDYLEDKDAYIYNGFLIVSSDREDQLPTWYNLTEIAVLQGVDAAQETPTQPAVIRFI